METITTDEIREKIIETNFYLLQAVKKNDEQKALRYKIELDSLIKLYFKK